MKIAVRARPGKRQSAVRKRDDGSYEIDINAQPINNQANERLIEIIADHFHVARSLVRIVSGFNGHIKIIEMPDITDSK